MTTYMTSRFASALALCLGAVAPATAVTYEFYGAIGAREPMTPDGKFGASIWAYNSGFNPVGISLANSSNDGYAALYGSPAGGGTLSGTVYGSKYFYVSAGQLSYSILFDAPASAKAKITMTAFGNVSAWGSGYSTAFFSFGGDTREATTFSGTSLTGAASVKNFKWTLSKTVTGGSKIDVSLLTRSWVNHLYYTAVPGPGGASAFIDPTFTVAAVPEPASWAIMIAGFGLVGAVARRRGAIVTA